MVYLDTFLEFIGIDGDNCHIKYLVLSRDVIEFNVPLEAMRFSCMYEIPNWSRYVLS